jgi:hypothetical protein
MFSRIIKQCPPHILSRLPILQTETDAGYGNMHLPTTPHDIENLFTLQSDNLGVP